MLTNHNIQRAVLIDPGHIKSFGPILNEHAVGMLPIAGKPLIQHWCEYLVDAGIHDVVLLLKHHPEQVRELLGSGRRWGVNIHINLLQEELSIQAMLETVSGFIRSPTLIAGIHMLPLAGFQSWINDVQEQCELPAFGFIGESANLWGIITRNWLQQNHSEKPVSILPCHGRACHAINHPKMLWNVNMSMLSGEMEDIHSTTFETAPGIMKAHATHLHKSSALQAPVLIGENSVIAKDCTIGSKVMIGNNVMIEKGCNVQRSLIFDRSYIGSYSDVCDSIVAGSILYRVNHNIFTNIDDPKILGSIDSTYHHHVSWSQRFIAALLLLLVSPLLAIKTMQLKLKNSPAWRHETLSIPYGVDLTARTVFSPLEVVSLAEKSGKWRKIPWLWQVIQGHLNLLGRDADSKEDSGNQFRWARNISEYPIGVICLSDLSLDTNKKDAAEMNENILIADSYYHAFRSWKMDFQLISMWIFRIYRPGQKSASCLTSTHKGERSDAN